MPNKSDNRKTKALRLIDSGRVAPMPPTQRLVYGVDGDHATYLVTFLRPDEAKPVRSGGTRVPQWSCTCDAGRERVLCSHVLAAATLREQELRALAETDERQGVVA